MILRQFLHTDPVVAASYLVACGGRGVAAVVDPVDAIEPYLATAAAHGTRIRYVLDTHIHADHISSGRLLAAEADAEYLLGPGDDGALGARRVTDGESLALGNVTLEIMHAPGHTPEHIVVLVTDRTRGLEPWAALTGHALLVGDMGRTELASDPVTGAEQLFVTAARLRALPDHVLILPGAFSGSVCGRGLSGNPLSTIGFERRFNPALRVTDRGEFVHLMLERIPPPPPRAAEVRAANLGLDPTVVARR